MLTMKYNIHAGLFEEPNTEIRFAEWWNKGGIDFFIKDNNNEEFLTSLSDADIQALAIIALSTGHLNLKTIKKEAKRLYNENNFGEN